jgi:drug/metabolite transporter (DMT)-like permease
MISCGMFRSDYGNVSAKQGNPPPQETSASATMASPSDSENRDAFRLLLASWAFVPIWSTGFIGARMGTPYAEPLSFLTLRFAVAAAGLVLFVLLTRSAWPKDWRMVAHICVFGLLAHGGYLGGVFIAIDRGVTAGVSALIVGLQPLLTGMIAPRMLGEEVSWRQWAGLLVGLAGVALVVWQKIDFTAGDGLGFGLCVLALVSITIGTLYQKRFCSDMPLRSGSAIQFMTAGAACGIGALFLEDFRIEWTGEFVFAFAWLVIVLSWGAVGLLLFLIRNGAATKITSLFYLVPPMAALLGFLLFGETLGPLSILGFALAAGGVALVTRN